MSSATETGADTRGARITDILNDGMLALLTSMGHELGLFEALAKISPASTQRIAEETGLNERYVREWVNAMTAGRIVDCDAATGTYTLPAEYAAMLTQEAGQNNMAAFIHTIALLCDRRNEVMECFRGGGGVPYERYREFLGVWEDLSALKFKHALIEQLQELAPTVTRALESGIDVLEIGCGAGHAANVMAQAFPDSRFTGYDLREDAIEQARETAKELGNDNLRLEVRNLMTMDEPEAYELITAFDVIHDQAHPRPVLQKVAESLRPGGTFLMVDIKASSHPHENLDHPVGPFLYGTSLLHCMTVSLAYAGEGLGAMWGEQLARELLAEAGFSDVEVRQHDDDPFNNFYLARR